MHYEFAPFSLNASARELRRGHEVVHLEPRIFDLLLHLVSHRDRVVSTRELLDVVWGGRATSRASVSVGVAAVRHALGDSASRQRFVRTYTGRGYRFVRDAFARSESVTSRRPAPFVGRGRELAQLDAGLESARHGKGRLYLVHGEPGIGKSRICEELATRARAQGIAFGSGRCSEVGATRPGRPWIQVLMALLSLGQDAEGSGIDPDLLAWLRSAGRAGSRKQPSRVALVDALEHLLRASPGRAALVTIDDLHRADAFSLGVLRLLGRELAGLPLVVVATHRDAEPDLDPPFRESLAELAFLAVSLPLSGLDQGETEQLLEHALEAATEPDLARQLLKHTGGNPFYLLQIASTIACRSGAGETGSRDSIEVPSTLREAVLQRMARLPAPSVDILRSASVIGRTFELRLLAAMSDVPIERVRELLDPALAARWIVAHETLPGVMRFVHLLVRDIVYARLPVARRASLHQRCARALEAISGPDRDPQVFRLAEHFYLAGSETTGTAALEYTRRAASLASERFDHAECRRQTLRAIEVMERIRPHDARLRAELLLGLGHATHRGGDREAAREILARAASIAEELGEAEMIGRAALGIAPSYLALEVDVDDPVHVGLMRRALASLGRSDTALRCRLQSRLAIAVAWSEDEETRRHLCDQAERAARELRSRELGALARIARWIALWDPCDFRGREALARAIVGELRVLDRESSLVAHLLAATTHLEQGDVVSYRKIMHEYRSLVRKLKQPEAEWYGILSEAVVAIMQGCLDEAERLRDSFYRLGSELADANAFECYCFHTLLVGRERESLAGMIPLIGDGRSRHRRMASWEMAAACAEMDAGNREAAERTLEGMLAGNIYGLEWVWLMAVGAELSCELGRLDWAARLYDRLRPCSGCFAVAGFGAGCLGAVDRYLGLLAATLGRPELADRHLQRAIAQEERSGAHLWRAHAEIDRAQVMARRGADPRRLERIAVAVRSQAVRFGSKRLRVKAERLLHACGSR